MELPDLIVFIDEKFSEIEKFYKKNERIDSDSFNSKLIKPIRDKLHLFDSGEISYYGLERFDEYLNLLYNESTNITYEKSTILNEVDCLKNKITFYNTSKNIEKFY